MIAFIFDRDGVILDSEKANLNSGVNAFKALGINLTEEEKKHIIARYPDDYIKYYQDKYEFSYEKFRELQILEYYELLKITPIFYNTINFIKTLKQKKIKLALTTSSNIISTEKVLIRTGLEDIFDVIVTYEDCSKRKPDPEPYLITAEKLGIDPFYCVVVEDSEIGLISAKKAGMRCIIIPNEYTKDQDFKKADLVVDSAEGIDTHPFFNS